MLKIKMSATSPNRDVFQALADPTRRSLLKLLAREEMSIVSIARRFPISRTAVNKHLRILSDARLVHSRKIGRETRFRLQPESLLELRDWLSFFEPYWDDRLRSLRQYVESDGE